MHVHIYYAPYSHRLHKQLLMLAVGPWDRQQDQNSWHCVYNIYIYIYMICIFIFILIYFCMYICIFFFDPRSSNLCNEMHWNRMLMFKSTCSHVIYIYIYTVHKSHPPRMHACMYCWHGIARIKLHTVVLHLAFLAKIPQQPRWPWCQEVHLVSRPALVVPWMGGRKEEPEEKHLREYRWNFFAWI